MNIYEQSFKGDERLKLISNLALIPLDDGKQYDIIIKEHKERRSLKANAYSWVLTDKLAQVMTIAGATYSKDEMHAEMIFRYGQQETDGHGDPVFVYLPESVKMTDYYPYAKPIGSGRLGGKPTTQWQIFRGSHEYSKSEMSSFIDGIVSECHEQGIETKTPDEIARIISLMEEQDG